MLRNKTEIHCDNCTAEIESPKDVNKVTYFGTVKGKSTIIRAMLCPKCAEEFQSYYHALFVLA